MRKQSLVWQTLKNEIQQEHVEHCRSVVLRAADLELESNEAAG